MMRRRIGALVWSTLAAVVGGLFAVNFVLAQEPSDSSAVIKAPEPPLSETRLTVHTLLREDIFAGFLDGDMKRFERGEKNIALLMEQRPSQKADLLAWKGGAMLYRAVRAYEAHQNDKFQTQYQHAVDLLAEAGKLRTGNDGVAAITGGSYVLFADRLPKEKRAAAWEQAYRSYQTLWKQQSAVIESLPLHFRGEVLGGLVVSAERTGHAKEAEEYRSKMLAVLRNTIYEPSARKENSPAGSNSSLTCLGCHEAGRLAARLSALNKK